MTEEELDRIKKAYSSGLKVQIWFNGYWRDFDIQDYSMYSEPFSERRQYRIVGSDYADIAEKQIAELEEEIAELKEQNTNLQEMLKTERSVTCKDEYLKKVTELEKKIRCECTRCVYSDSPCIRSDYGVENDEDVCPNYENVFAAYTQLKEENAELKKVYDETQDLLDEQIEVTFRFDKENAELKTKVTALEQENAELKETVRLMNEQEARDIRTRFPC